MAIFWKRGLYSFLVVACLVCTQPAVAALTCQESEGEGTKISIAYSDTNEYSRFEFTPSGGDGQWVGVVFEFFGSAPTNKLLRGISPTVQGKELSEQFTRSFIRHLEEQMPYDAVSDIRYHELDGRFVTTFDTVFGDHRDFRAVYGQWDGGDFQFFRVLVPDDGSSERSEKVALEAMQQMIGNCLNHEA